MTHDEMIAVIQAHRDGKAIQYRHKCSEWSPAPQPNWNFSAYDYRIKPEPLECWVNVYPQGVPSIWGSEQDAKRTAGSNAARIAVHMKEVES